MFLGEGKQAHDHQSRQNKSVYEVLHHGYHSTGLAHYVAGDRAPPKMMNAVGAAVNALQDRFEPGRPRRFLGAKLTWRLRARTSEFDPKATF